MRLIARITRRETLNYGERVTDELALQVLCRRGVRRRRRALAATFLVKGLAETPVKGFESINSFCARTLAWR